MKRYLWILPALALIGCENEATEHQEGIASDFNKALEQHERATGKSLRDPVNPLSDPNNNASNRTLHDDLREINVGRRPKRASDYQPGEVPGEGRTEWIDHPDGSELNDREKARLKKEVTERSEALLKNSLAGSKPEVFGKVRKEYRIDEMAKVPEIYKKIAGDNSASADQRMAARKAIQEVHRATARRIQTSVSPAWTKQASVFSDLVRKLQQVRNDVSLGAAYGGISSYEAFAKIDEFKKAAEEAQKKWTSDVTTLNAEIASLKELITNATRDRDAALAQARQHAENARTATGQNKYDEKVASAEDTYRAHGLDKQIEQTKAQLGVKESELAVAKLQIDGYNTELAGLDSSSEILRKTINSRGDFATKQLDAATKLLATINTALEKFQGQQKTQIDNQLAKAIALYTGGDDASKGILAVLKSVESGAKSDADHSSKDEARLSAVDQAILARIQKRVNSKSGKLTAQIDRYSADSATAQLYATQFIINLQYHRRLTSAIETLSKAKTSLTAAITKLTEQAASISDETTKQSLSTRQAKLAAIEATLGQTLAGLENTAKDTLDLVKSSRANAQKHLGSAKTGFGNVVSSAGETKTLASIKQLAGQYDTEVTRISAWITKVAEDAKLEGDTGS